MSQPSRKPASVVWGRGRNLLLTAARDLFAEHGYDSVTTRQIAESAGVSEQMVFRHFGSKANLFEAAAVAPFVEHLDAYVADWERRPTGERDAVEEAADLYRGMYEVFAANRGLLAALLSFQGDSPSGSAEAIGGILGPALDRFADLLTTEQKQRGFRDFDTRIVVRLVAGLVMSQTAFGDLLYGDDAPPRAEAIIREMAMLTIFGAWPPEAFGPLGEARVVRPGDPASR
ncbi:TetR/AcrR family transcriptional regulator [Nocardioides sp. WS12]|uniref:TetR/AcrR family transcriptional regulator n=1 Tax=Nocardioides sp. WS12 TaxID=2486272 RepID=UPI0015F9B2A5|nr:TetR/AcrR family transcriptional regulator [Nocardioides sp. WS12]